MGSQLNIKGEQAYAMASELAGLTGESMTAAMVEAVRLRLQQERLKRDRAQLLRAVKAISAEVRERLGPSLPTSDHSWLYGEDGSPK